MKRKITITEGDVASGLAIERAVQRHLAPGCRAILRNSFVVSILFPGGMNDCHLPMSVEDMNFQMRARSIGLPFEFELDIPACNTLEGVPPLIEPENVVMTIPQLTGMITDLVERANDDTDRFSDESDRDVRVKLGVLMMLADNCVFSGRNDNRGPMPSLRAACEKANEAWLKLHARETAVAA